jgi:hypothetical protein
MIPTLTLAAGLLIANPPTDQKADPAKSALPSRPTKDERDRNLFELTRRLLELTNKRESIHKMMELARVLPVEFRLPLHRYCLTLMDELLVDYEKDVKKYDEKYGTNLARGTIIGRAAPDGPHWKLSGRDERDELRLLFEEGLKSSGAVSGNPAKEGQSPGSRRP